MLMYVPQWFVTQRSAAVAIGSLLISAFNAILVCVASQLLCIVIKTVRKNIVIASRSLCPGQSDLIMCVD